jgi:DNA-binding beta-propeller fold protein YncE
MVLLVNRREFVFASAALVLAPAASARRLGGTPTALVTADLESHVVAVDVGTGEVLERIRSAPGPRAIERVQNDALVAHTEEGLLTVIDGARLRVRRELGGFAQPRYAAAWRSLAFVTDSAAGQLVAVDVESGRVLDRLQVGGAPRHLSLEPSGRVVWVVLGNTADRIAVVDVRDPRRLRLVRRFAPPFPAHDVGFGSGRVWVTGGDSRRIVVYGGNRALRLAADAPPQHVTFLGARAFVASGDSGTLRVHDARTGSLLRTSSIPLGSYNVDRAGGGAQAVTPSLSQGTVCVADASGRVVRRVRVARSSHDACVVVTP